MMAQAQCKAIGKAARFGDLFRGQRATRHWHLYVLANLRRGIGGKGQLDLGFMRNRTRGAGEDRLEGFERSLVGHYPLPTTLSGKSLPKTRW